MPLKNDFVVKNGRLFCNLRHGGERQRRCDFMLTTMKIMLKMMEFELKVTNVMPKMMKGCLPRSFNFGWATSHPVGADEVVEYQPKDHHDMSNWGGYAANQGAFYLNEDAYILIGVQVMLSTPGGNDKGLAIIKDASFAAWHSVWG